MSGAFRVITGEATEPRLDPRDLVDRLPRFVGLSSDPPAALAALAALRVLLVGAGSVGAVLALHLARLGVGALAVVDPGRYKANLGTQPILPADVGQPKAALTAARAKAISPRTEVRALDGPVQNLGWSDLAGYDLCGAATDNLEAEVDLGRRTSALGIPLFYASVHGETLTAQVRVLRHEGEGPCIACGFGAAEWDALARGDARYACALDAEMLAAAGGPPTMSVSPLCALAADLAALLVVRHALGLGPALGDCVVEHNAYRMQTITTPLARHPRCPVDHVRYAPAHVAGRLADRTLRECLETVPSGVPAAARERATFAVDDLVYAARLVCPDCGRLRPEARFMTRTRTVAADCAGCGARRDMSAHPFHVHERVAAERLGPDLDRPLSSLGAPDASMVRVHGGGRSGLLVRGRVEPLGAGRVIAEPAVAGSVLTEPVIPESGSAAT